MTDSADSAGGPDAEPTLVTRVNKLVAESQDPATGDLHRALTKEVQAATARGDAAAAGCFRAIRDIAFMRLEPDNGAAPYQPMWVDRHNRSPVPDDLTEEQLDAIDSLLTDMIDGRLRGRLADVLAIRRPQDRHVRWQEASEAFLAAPFLAGGWTDERRREVQRGVGLLRKLKKVQAEKFSEFKDRVLAVVLSPGPTTNRMAQELAEELDRHGLAKDARADIAARFLDDAATLRNAQGWTAADASATTAIRWFRRAGDAERAAEAEVERAAAIAAQAEAAGQTGFQGPAVEAYFLINALQVLRQIDRKQRERLGVDDLISKYSQRLETAQLHSVEQLPRGEPIEMDLTAIVERVRLAVSGATLPAAIETLAFGHQIGIEKLRSDAAVSKDDFLLRRLFGTTKLNQEGKPIAHASPAGGAPNELEDEMVRRFELGLGVVVAGVVLPALRCIHIEHVVDEWAVASVVARSTLVPPNRERLVTKGLFAGFHGDFPVAMHLLAPQLEHLVRIQLKGRGVSTTQLTQESTEMELGLSSLTEKSEFQEIFPADLSFGIRALYCHRLGPNIRNVVAHSLAGDDVLGGHGAAFAWWFFLHLVAKTTPATPQEQVPPEFNPPEPAADGPQPSIAM